jgi:hypothetical protein
MAENQTKKLYTDIYLQTEAQLDDKITRKTIPG